MLTNQTFLDRISEFFKSFINSGTSRSTAKLKPLHGAIAQDLSEMLGTDYTVKSQGYGDDKEDYIKGRYMDKMVDITIKDKSSDIPVCGIAVKFVMQNYSQNSNNYFENMLGETANIRSANCPYFQIFIILDKLPYYKSNGTLCKWEEFTEHNISKYSRLSNDNTDIFYHTPNKTLICVVHITPETDAKVKTKAAYLHFYNTNEPTISFSGHVYSSIKAGGTVIMNDYKTFIDKVYHTIKSR